MITITALYDAKIRVNEREILYYYMDPDDRTVIVVLSNGYVLRTRDAIEAIDERIRQNDQSTQG